MNPVLYDNRTLKAATRAVSVHETVRDGPTKKTYEKGENHSQDNKAPVPCVIVSDKCNAKEHKNDAVARCTVR